MFPEFILIILPNDEEFMHFVNRVLMLGTSSPIQEFQLKFPEFSKDKIVYLWLELLLRRRIKVLEIEQKLGLLKNMGICLNLPTDFFQSKTLVVLKLYGGTFSFDSGEYACFPNLKVLSLKHLKMHLKSILRFADDGYPLLEDLTLTGLYHPYNQTNIEISLSSLKRLEIDGLDPSGFTKIDVDTPDLQHLRCDIRWQISFNISKCVSLESVSFSINPATGSFGHQTLMETLGNLSSVKVLHIDINGIPNIYSADKTLKLCPFPYLNQLRYSESSYINPMSKAIFWTLLKCAPNLRSVIIQMDEFGKFMSPTLFVPVCFGKSLEEIRLNNFKGTDSEIAMLEWLLNQGVVLREIVLQHGYYVLNNVKLENMNHLLKLVKLHPKCEIKFVRL